MMKGTSALIFVYRKTQLAEPVLSSVAELASTGRLIQHRAKHNAVPPKAERVALDDFITLHLGSEPTHKDESK
jgi:hypothetical protein